MLLVKWCVVGCLGELASLLLMKDLLTATWIRLPFGLVFLMYPRIPCQAWMPAKYQAIGFTGAERSNGCFSVCAAGWLQKEILGVFCLKIFQIWFKRFRDLLFVEGKLPIQIRGRPVNLHTTDLTSICYNTEDL